MRIAVAFFTILTLSASIFLMHIFPVPSAFSQHSFAAEVNRAVTFSETAHFHTSGITVEITSPYAEIFFTTDGSLPSADSSKYTEPLYFELRSEMYAVVLRAVAKQNGKISAPHTHTYFIGENICFGSDIWVFSLSTNPQNLFDHDIGILVEGRIREEFLHENPDADHYLNPANFFMRGREWERPVHIETFSSCGERLLSQDAGLRVHGNTSRAIESQKPLRLISRREYSPHTGRFHFDFFPGAQKIDGTPLTEWNTLVLRHGVNPSVLRNELGYSLAAKAGLEVSPVRGASVFLNGEFYGFAWLQARLDAHYLQAFFNAPSREFDIVDEHPLLTGSVAHPVLPPESIMINDPQLAADLAFKFGFAHKNLSDDDIFAELTAIADVENFLLYSAFQIFADNFDWIFWRGHNFRQWRYTGKQTAELDGRWRYAVVDLDAAFGLVPFAADDTFQTGMTFARVLEPGSTDDRKNELLINILTRPDMAELFTMMMCDIAANVINYQTVNAQIDMLFSESVRNEIERSGVRWYRNEARTNREHQIISDFAANRYRCIFQSLSEYFDFPQDMFIVQIIGGEAIIGTQRGTSSQYFNHLTVPVRPAELCAFNHWLLNGEKIYEAELAISFADARAGRVILELVGDAA
ncbi:MAG: CotH kinase family protein [Defluviitaleaceae bacterium]|nr:CotH kinase family protein [Defluviitaleaceae bacterium]